MWNYFYFCVKCIIDMRLDISQVNNTKDEVPLSRFEEEEKRANDEAAAMAKKLEEKYVSSIFCKPELLVDVTDFTSEPLLPFLIDLFFYYYFK